MHELRRRTLVQTGMCTDLAICGVGVLLGAHMVQQGIWDHGTVLLRNPIRQIMTTVLLSLCWHISLVLTGAYRSYRRATIRSQVAALIKGATAATFCVAGWLVASRGAAPMAPASLARQLAFFWIFTSTCFLFTRLAGRICMLAFRRRGRNLRSILIVGSNRRAIAIADKFTRDIGLGYRIVGFVDDCWFFDGAPSAYKKLLLGDLNSLLDLLRTTAIDEVVIALPLASFYGLIEQIAGWCSQQGLRVTLEASLFGSSPPPFKADDRMGGTITLYDATPAQGPAAVKLMLDLLISGCALLLFAPLLAAIALGVHFSSPGPIFYRQKRLGRGKKPFSIFKFRTMVADAELRLESLEHLNQSGGPTFKLQRDPRITRFGAFLRRTSLDELPQLLNVISGEMSLVGPRPLPLRDYQGFSKDWHRRRFSVRPGITGIWQVNGRSSIPFEKWMELDMDYIDRWTLWLDLTILARTIPAVLRGTGAV